jgi:hypothetical protein
MRRRLQAKLKEVNTELRRRLNVPVRNVGEWLSSVLRGHYRYYGVVGNFEALSRFRYAVAHLWHRTLQRRSQKASVRWERMARLIKRWLPRARIYHPAQPTTQLRLAFLTRDKSPVRQFRTPGSEAGAP